MRRTAIIECLDSVLEALESSGVAGILSSAGGSQGQNRKRPSAADTVRRFHEFAAAAGRFNDDQLEVLSAFDLDALLDTNTWLAFAIESEGASPALQRTLNYKYRTFRAYAPKMLSMVQNEGQRLRDDPPEGTQTLTLILPVDEDDYAEADRVIKGVTGIQKLYAICAKLSNVEDEDIRVVACDSGPDLTFDLLGDATVMALLAEVLDSIWERVIFHRSLDLEERNRRVVDTLPVLHQIAKQSESGALEKEEAELMRRRVSTGATAFMEAGCLVESFEEPIHHGARELMAPTMRLIQGPIEGEELSEPQVSAGPLAHAADATEEVSHAEA